VFGQSFLERTRQSWKYVLTESWLTYSGLALMTLGAFEGENSRVAGTLILTGLMLSVGGHVWAAVSIKCPACRTRLYWKGMREVGWSEFDSWLLTLSCCPTCGDDGSRGADLGV
jgi:hypothetical protein